MTNQIKSRNEWIFNHTKNILDDRDSMLRAEISKMLAKSVKMFKYNNLPPTISHKDLETYLQVNGFTVWKKVNDELYVFFGSLGGEPNAYYLPTKAVVANPYLKYSETLEIDKDCVVMLNDYYYQGMMPVFNKYANLLVDAELTLRQCILNTRIPVLVESDNESTYQSALEFFENIREGRFGAILGKPLIDNLNLKTHEFTKETHITDVIEAIQYIKGSWYNEMGLNAAFNMKREAINEAEATLNEDILFPTAELMLECRRIGLEKVNAMFGTNITVEFDSVWKSNKEQQEIALALEEKELETDDTREYTTINDTANTDTN